MIDLYIYSFLHRFMSDVVCAVQDGQTFLMIACQLGNCHIIQRLLDEPEVDVNAVDNVSLCLSV